MGAAWRIGAWTRQLSWKTNCSGELARPGAHRFKRESVLRPDLLVESTSTQRSRDRLRKRTRSEMAARTLDGHLRLQSGPVGHGRRARLELSAFVYHPVIKRAHHPAGHELEILRRLFSATRSRPIAGL